MQVVVLDLGVDAALIAGEVIVIAPGLGYVRTYSAIRTLIPLASPAAVQALTEQACPRLRLLTTAE